MSRIWGVRHLRYFYWSWRLASWVECMAQIGLGFGGADQSDIDHLNAIWRGEL